MTPLEVDNWIKSTVGEVQAENTVNILETNKLSLESTADFKSLRKDLTEERYDITQPHYNVVMADWNPEESGVYFLYGVNNNKFIYSVGVGDPWKIKETLNQLNLTEIDMLIKQLKEKKFEKGRIEIDRSYGEIWLDYNFSESELVSIEPAAPIETPEIPHFLNIKKPWWQFW